MPPPPFYLGCPVWTHPRWPGAVLGRGTKTGGFLKSYAALFPAVEGNSTFYATPPADTLRRWREETPEHFRFCCKFPRAITHERHLRQAGPETAVFLDRMEKLRGRLGPLLLQLPPDFAPPHLLVLENYLESLPRYHNYAVEVRHPGFFRHGADSPLHRMLEHFGASRCMFDTRGLFAREGQPEDGADARDPLTVEARRKKPRLPVTLDLPGVRPLVRFVGFPGGARAENEPLLDEWAACFARWISEGKEPYFFAHSADNFFSPHVARQFHQRLQRILPSLPDSVPWPGEARVGDAESAAPKSPQMELF